MQQILGELREIRRLLESGGPRQGSIRLSADISGAPAIGSTTAPLAIVEFTDYECEFCQRFERQTFPDLKRHYIDTGKVRFYTINFPLEKHSRALLVAQATQCALEQSAFWPMRERIRANPAQLDLATLIHHAERAGMDVSRFRNCVESNKHRDAIRSAMSTYIDKGVQGTPSFIIGRNETTLIEGELVTGAVPFGTLQAKLDSLR